MHRAYLGLDCHTPELIAYQKLFPELKHCSPLHITLKFFGEVDGPHVQEIIAGAQKIHAQPVQIQTKQITGFHPMNRLFYIDIVKTKTLIQLQTKIERSLSHLYESDFRFNPHLTLVRSKKKLSRDGLPIIKEHSWTAKEFHLYEKKEGDNEYKITRTFKLS